jgi:Family of unknown function (DUF5995)
VAGAPLPRVERAARIDDVIERLQRIAAELPADDGVAAFTRLYLAVTERVRATGSADGFEDDAFVRWLDVTFANLYFAAVNTAADSTQVPRAWAPLFEARSARDVLPLQFALAGMNAHINRDLPVALLETSLARRTDLQDDSPQRRDFLRINKLLESTEAEMKRPLLTGVVGEVDVALGRLDDVLAMWKVERARDAAWTNAQTLSALHEIPSLRTAFLETLDRMVGFAGRGLLRPVVIAARR